jgi:hypothetical protein
MGETTIRQPQEQYGYIQSEDRQDGAHRTTYCNGLATKTNRKRNKEFLRSGPQATGKQLGVDFFTEEEFYEHINSRNMSLPYRLADIDHHMKQLAEAGQSVESMFSLYARMSREQWSTMLNHSIIAAQKAARNK